MSKVDDIVESGPLLYRLTEDERDVLAIAIGAAICDAVKAERERVIRHIEALATMYEGDTPVEREDVRSAIELLCANLRGGEP